MFRIALRISVSPYIGWIAKLCTPVEFSSGSEDLKMSEDWKNDLALIRSLYSQIRTSKTGNLHGHAERSTVLTQSDARRVALKARREVLPGALVPHCREIGKATPNA